MLIHGDAGRKTPIDQEGFAATLIQPLDPSTLRAAPNRIQLPKPVFLVLKTSLALSTLHRNQ